MMPRIEYFLFRSLVGLLALLPFSLLCLVASPLFLLLFHLLRYRRRVVDRNLTQAFPNLSPPQRQDLARTFYHQFCYVLLETVKGWTMSADELRRRYRFRNAEIFDPLFHNGQSAIVAGGHFGNWEWGSLSFSLWVKAPVIGIYIPLKNPYIEAYLRRCRCRWGLQLAPMAQTGRALVQHRHQASLFVLIADQSPSNLEAAHWLDFFGRETPFLNGIDKIARRSNYPVYYFDIHRRGPGDYEIDFHLLAEAPQQLPEGAITARYRDALVASIRRQPASWLWSHRRWKRAR